MKFVALAVIALRLFSSLSFGGEKEEAFLREKMIPLAHEFIKRNGLPYDAEFGTNRIARSSVDFYDDGRPGGQGTLILENGYCFYFASDGRATEIWDFHDHTKTYYHVDIAPKEQVDAVKALNLKNKLNDQTALDLARKYFNLQGYREEDFHPVEFQQLIWTGGPEVTSRFLPYYRAEWYRKDVNLGAPNARNGTVPRVAIEVSGITTNLLYYSSFMPIGSTFDSTNSRQPPH